MGQGLRLLRTPDGQTMTQGAHGQYMQNVYQPQQAFEASAYAPIPGMSPMNMSGGSSGYSGWRPQGGSRLLGNAISEVLNEGLTSEQWRGLLPAGQGNQLQGPPAQSGLGNSGFAMAGPYANQALGMAGLLNPHTPPGDTYPNGGLLGGKGGRIRPGK